MKLTEARNQFNINYDNIPEEMKDQSQWVCWKADRRDNGKVSKIPINPINGRYANVNDSTTWSRFEDAIEAYQPNGYSGIGFMFSESDDFVGIDLDDCIDPETGEIEPDAEEIIRQMGSYTEISPSGRGVHIPYYDPLIPPTVQLERHYFWSNFTIPEKKFEKPAVRHRQVRGDTVRYGIDIKDKKFKNTPKVSVIRNCVDPDIGDYILDLAKDYISLN